MNPTEHPSPSAVPATQPKSATTPARFALSRWLREPLFLFMVAGASLFAIYAWLNPNPADADAHRIVLTDDDLLQMTIAMRAQGYPSPSPDQVRSMVDSKIREEVLYREALAMGLDQNDTIVKRRMAQKMDFLAEDISALREPTREELQEWFANHPRDFAYPPRVTFRHIYFSPDNHKAQTQAVAADALSRVSQWAEDAPEMETIGDRFMFQDHYADRTPDQIGAIFGGVFASNLFAQQSGTWVGPIESGFGWHLVHVEELTPGETPQFEQVEPEVKAAWVANQRTEFKQAAYEMMREKYEVVMPPLLDETRVQPAPEKPTGKGS